MIDRVPTSHSRLPVLYTILDAEVAERAGWTLVDLASACLAGGARWLQVRAKGASPAWLLDVTSTIARLAHQAGGLVIVNDRADLARMGAADGVHVGQTDLPVSAARAVVGPGRMIGLSTHTTPQLAAACQDKVTYIAIGPVYRTSTKATGYNHVGLDMVRHAAEVTGPRGLPLVAIGGITLDTAADVMDAGASSVAVISDLLTTGDPEARVGAYLKRLTV